MHVVSYLPSLASNTKKMKHQKTQQSNHQIL